jgi:hypothetical protein
MLMKQTKIRNVSGKKHSNWFYDVIFYGILSSDKKIVIFSYIEKNNKYQYMFSCLC